MEQHLQGGAGIFSESGLSLEWQHFAHVRELMVKIFTYEHIFASLEGGEE
jgi:hypothetical protein